MYIVLPTKIDGLDELVSRIDSSKIQQLHFLKTEIKVSIPKFKILNTIKLNEILKSVNIFRNSNANYSGRLFILSFIYSICIAWNSEIICYTSIASAARSTIAGGTLASIKYIAKNWHRNK